MIPGCFPQAQAQAQRCLKQLQKKEGEAGRDVLAANGKR